MHGSSYRRGEMMFLKGIWARGLASVNWALHPYIALAASCVG